MRLGINGRLTDEPAVRVGFIGCGSHAFRNVFPTLQFVPAELVAVCDREIERAEAFKKQFGAERAYQDHRDMLAKEKLDAVLPRHLTLAASLTIGIPGFFLALAPSSGRYSSRGFVRGRRSHARSRDGGR
jgi:hypothetical protein